MTSKSSRYIHVGGCIGKVRQRMKSERMGKVESREKTGEGLEIESQLDGQEEKEEELYEFTTGYFCAGAVVKDGKIILAAPIIAWMTGARIKDIIRNFKGEVKKVG